MAEEIGGFRLVFLRRQQLILGLADGAGDAVRRESDVIDPGRVERILGQPRAVVLVVNREIAVDVDAVVILAQEPGAEAVKRAHPHPAIGDERLDPLPHFAGGLVRKCDCEDVKRADALPQKPGDSARDDTGLATAGPGQDQERPVEMRNGVLLGGRQVGQQVRLPGSLGHRKLSERGVAQHIVSASRVA